MAAEVRFGEHQLPAMEAGTYRVRVGQEVTRNGRRMDGFDGDLEVAVQGVRFTLPPDRVHGRYPAPGALDDYADVLPHIVLSAPTLPWQREPVRGEERTPDPWLALLLFDHPAPEVEAGPVREVVGGAGFLGRGELDAWQDATAACQYVDLDADVFRRLVPEAAELRWLTHVRTVDDETYAVVVANRLPAPGGVSRCCLVSLDGVFPLPAPLPATVRLVVLETWTFGTKARSERFGATMRQLDVGTLRVPKDHPALDRGYAVLEHTMRQGAESVSWYRGPLLPSAEAAAQPPPPGRDAADELLGYDTQTGMFDISLAAAWQLGRLLALGDAERSVLIAGWKAQGHRARVLAGERRRMAVRLDVQAPEPAGRHAADALATPLVAGLHAVRRRAVAALEAHETVPPPEPIVDWLAGLRRLEGVPLGHLVPDARMLPPESLRFFALDGAWLDALCDGALSLRRADAADAALREAAIAASRERAGGPLTGFLLRSVAVWRWPTVAVTATGDSDAELPPLRRATLAPDVLLGLYAGTVRAVSFAEPAETQHFGFDVDGEAVSKRLRSLPDADSGPETVDVPMRADRVLDLAALSRRLAERLDGDGFSPAGFAIELAEGVDRVHFRSGTAG